MASTVPSCSNSECQVRINGTCAEGRTLLECPYYAPGNNDSEDAAHAVTSLLQEDDLVPIEEASRLTSAEAAGLLQEFKASVVAIVGPSDTGKTSLIAGIYDLFLHGPIEPFEFASSKTMHAFEEACHGARLLSGLTEPNSERTLSGPAKYFELTLGTAYPSATSRVLIADRWGEDYKGLLDSHPRAEEFSEIARADVLTMMVDGQRILDSLSRFQVSEEVVAMLQVFLEVGLLARRPHIALVLTKLDVVNDAANGARALEDFERLLARVNNHFGTWVSGVSAFRTAASPKVPGAKAGEGLPALLSCWVRGRTPAAYVRTPYAPVRQIDALQPDMGG